jgi:hypothetical protein
MTSGPEVPAHGKANMTEEEWERYETDILNRRWKRWLNRDQSITSTGYWRCQQSQQSKARR